MIVLRLGERWLQFDGKRLVTVPAFPQCSGAVGVIDDFAGAPAGSRALDGKPEHANAVIERQMRSEGLVDGESHVLIHHRTIVPGGVQTLFTAVSVDVWQQVQAWAQAQPDHCQVVPLLALLSQHVSNGTGIVLNYGRSLVFLAQQGSSLRYASMMAFSENPDDLLMAMASLGDQVRSLLAGGSSPELIWCALDAPQDRDDDGLRAAFLRSAGVALQACPSQLVAGGDGVRLRSGLGYLLNGWSDRDAINPQPARLLVAAESWLPVAAMVCVVIALALFGYGAYAYIKSNDILREASQRTLEAVKRSEIASNRLMREVPPARYPAVRDFLARADRINTSYNPYKLVGVVRDAAGADARILRVRLDKDPKGLQSIVIDGALKETAMDGQGLSRIITRLRMAGYEPAALNPADASQSTAFFSYRLVRKAS
ncbi:hypothetical protein Q9Q94_03490 [Uliginosibacterium sp. 31-16]|uniref:hypothetical protein n=1 Tax=Uliginosibacterium sp. 31-16 TaxID=3068315 RepID=UPI00273F95B7|nr:hypothetical protein [Uliginosibacterium sp. 31-16]MDP5238575.1 hypothetical protein [Uliginosibacterium sp. 31-16]